MSSPALPVETTPALNEGQRLVYTFTAPSRTMEDLRRNASWWVPWLIISLASLAFCFALEKRIGWDQIVESQIQKNPKAVERIEKMPADQRASMMKMQVNISRGIGYSSPIMTVVGVAIIAGVLLGLFNFGFGAKLKFAELMAISMYSSLVSLGKTILSVLMMFLVEPDAFDIQNPVATNLGYFVPQSMKFLSSLLSAVDVFTIWQIVLIAIGVSKLSKVKTVPAFIAVYGLYFVIKLIGAGLGSM